MTSKKAAVGGAPVWQPSRICVVGGAGFLGSILAEQLLDEGYQVTILDAFLYGDEGIRHLADPARPCRSCPGTSATSPRRSRHSGTPTRSCIWERWSATPPATSTSG